MVKPAPAVALGDGQQSEVMKANHQVAMSVSGEIGGQQLVGAGDFRRIGRHTGQNPDRGGTEQANGKSEAIHVTDSRINLKGRSIIGDIVQNAVARGVGAGVDQQTPGCLCSVGPQGRFHKLGGWER